MANYIDKLKNTRYTALHQLNQICDNNG